MKFTIHINELKLSELGGAVENDKELNLCFLLLKWQNIELEFFSHETESAFKKLFNTNKTFFIVYEHDHDKEFIKSFHSLYLFLGNEGLLFS